MDCTVCSIYTGHRLLPPADNGSSGGHHMDCTALTVVEQPALPAELTATLKLAADFAKASKAKATQDAYGSDFRIFESWCCPRGLRALPATAESLCAFLADQATLGKRASTLGRRLA